jgi:hypothetical protein
MVMRSRHALLVAGMCLLPLAGVESTGTPQQSGQPTSLGARAPVVREEHYVMNARVRPLLLFWIGRDDVGGARITWREGSDGRQGLEFLVGSDPARAPRRINHWGYIAEDARAGAAEIVGFMKESADETLEEAEARIERDKGGRTTFKAIRTTVTGNRAESGTLTFLAPSDITLHQLDTLLSLLPSTAKSTRTIDLPEHTEKGFLFAMRSLLTRSADPCQAGDRDGVKALGSVPYLYNGTLYDLSLSSCDYARELKTKAGIFAGIVDGRFQVRNRSTRDVTKFQVAFGTSGALRELPVRIVFRPRWWMEAELLLDRDGKLRP